MPGARLHLTHLSTAAVARPRAARKGRRPAGHVRRDAAPPRPDRRVARRRPALGLGGARRRRHGARPVARPARSSRRRTTRALRVNPPLRSPRRRRAPASRARWTARPMPSPPTTRRTPRSTRRSSSGSRARDRGHRDGARAPARGGRRRAADARAVDRGAHDRAGARARAARRADHAGLVEGAAGRSRRLRPRRTLDGRADGLRTRGYGSPLLGASLPGRVLAHDRRRPARARGPRPRTLTVRSRLPRRRTHPSGRTVRCLRDARRRRA